MKAIFGLGNPENKYLLTRHNIGFLFVDAVAEQIGGVDFKSEHQGLCARVSLAGQRVLLCKPQTFMNLSGRCFLRVIQYYKIDIKDCIVVFDDIDMEPGKTRIRKDGGAGGHNGIRSIIQETGMSDFNRLKIGIGRPAGKGSVSNYVLGRFGDSEIEELQASVFADAFEKLETLLKD